MKKVLFPIDNSSCVENTLNWAVGFLPKEQTEIYLLNVLYMVPDVPVTDYEIDEARKLLEKTRQFFESHGFRVAAARYITDVPGPAICRYADEVGMDQIVIGSHGRQGITRLLMGSVSQWVFQHATQPVLIVNNHTKLPSIQISHPDQVHLIQQ